MKTLIFVFAFIGIALFNLWTWCALWIDAASFTGKLLTLILSLSVQVYVCWRYRSYPLKWASALLCSPILISLWWSSLTPQQDRDWSAEYAKPPYAEIQGNQITLHHFRNNIYRSEYNFDAKWETRNFNLDQLQSVDLFMSYWGSPLIAHTLLSFNFGAQGSICTSIETRREKHEHYSSLKGFFRQFELYYVLGDERDLLGLRLIHRDRETTYYYPLKLNAKQAQLMFKDYLRVANELYQKPQWYHALFTNCTTAIRVHSQAAHFRPTYDWRIIANGKLDELLYERGVISNKLPFLETKEKAKIRWSPQELNGSEVNFAEMIRAQRPY